MPNLRLVIEIGSLKSALRALPVCLVSCVGDHIKNLAVKAGTFIHLPKLPCWASWSAFFVDAIDALVLLKWIFCNLICFGQATSLRYLCFYLISNLKVFGLTTVMVN